MPNYMEVIAGCFPGTEAYTTGDPTVYASIIWISTQITQAELDASVCAQGTFVAQTETPPSTVGGYHDIVEFGNSARVKDIFLLNSSNSHTCLDSSPIALASGEVVHVTISTEDVADANFFIQVITNAVKGGAGTYAGGTQIGTDIEKVSGSLDHVSKNLTGFNFNAGDRLAVYLKKGITGGGEAREPVVRLFIRYD